MADIEKQETNSCCTATPGKVDFEWVKNHPGQIFNTPQLKKERELLLADVRVPSCDVCWNSEDAGVISRRQKSNSHIKTHTDINSTPAVLNILIGSDCNLTCSYCCKQYSSAWAADIVNNGEYPVSDSNRYSMTQKDKVIYKLSQKEISKSKNRSVLIDELALLSADTIMVTGGEPFLNINLANLLSNLSANKSLEVFTGMGVSPRRFRNELEKIKGIPNLSLVISAENIRALYEFNRYGNSYDTFIKNLETVKELNIPFKFALTLSNLTLFGVADFIKEFYDCDITFTMCNYPTFLAVNVLDDTSKLKLSESLSAVESTIPDIVKSINAPCSQLQKQEAAVFIKEFASRRQLSLDIFPESFVNWINEQ